jgi:hypothetical protein
VYFTYKKEETGAIKQFQNTCTRHGLSIHLSDHSLNALARVIQGGEIIITTQQQYVLVRKGMIRLTSDGEMIVTELGLLTIAMGEAGGLVSLKTPKKA